MPEKTAALIVEDQREGNDWNREVSLVGGALAKFCMIYEFSVIIAPPFYTEDKDTE